MLLPARRGLAAVLWLAPAAGVAAAEPDYAAAWHNGVPFPVAGLLGAAFLATIAVRRLRAAARQRKDARTRAMLDAFDLARAGIVIFGDDLRAEVSNAAFDLAFPKLAAGVRSGLTLPMMMRLANDAGYFGAVLDAPALEARIAASLAEFEVAEGAETIMMNAEGRVFSRRGLRLSCGRVAVVTTDVSDLDESRRALALRATELKHANDRLEAFTRVAAHDLKSPATSAATLLDWIADDLAAAGSPPPEGVMDTIDKARLLLRRQVMLIDDLLAYARATFDGGSNQRLLPGERIVRVLDLVAPPAGFEVVVEGELPAVAADPAAFDLVIRNLVANAIKHHDRSEGRVVIRACMVGAEAVFEVADDGPGVPEAYAERVFEPFFKLRSHEEVEGSGLGLAMIRATVTAWGGVIGIVSDQGARGTVMRFTVPARGASVAPGATPAVRDGAPGGRVGEWVDGQAGGALTGPSAAGLQRAGARAPRLPGEAVDPAA